MPRGTPREDPRFDEDFQVPQLTVVDLDQVVVPVFKRGLSEKHAEEIASNWQPLLFRPPLLARRKDGKLDIIDGQHTIHAVRRRGHSAVPAFVREGTEYKVEAGAFADLNTRRRSLRPYEVWRAEAEAGRTWAITLDEVARRHGLKIAHERGPNALACISECRRILKKPDGAQLLDTALYILTRAWDDPKDDANSTRIERPLVTGMVDLIERVSPKAIIDQDGWVEKLQKAAFKVDGVEVKVTPRSWPSYVSQLIQRGKIVPLSLQTGSGQAAIQGKALAILILGERRAATLYR